MDPKRARGAASQFGDALPIPFDHVAAEDGCREGQNSRKTSKRNAGADA